LKGEKRMSNHKTKNANKKALQQAIDRIHEEMAKVSPTSDEYAKMADQLDKLYKLTTYKPAGLSSSTDQVIGIAGSLVGIGAIMSFERAHVITTKALGFVFKPR
jgi:hypothetical protein